MSHFIPNFVLLVKNVPKPDGQVNVTASFVVTTANFDEATRTLSGMVWLSVHWKDERYVCGGQVRIWATRMSFGVARHPTRKRIRKCFYFFSLVHATL